MGGLRPDGRDCEGEDQYLSIYAHAASESHTMFSSMLEDDV